MFFSFDIVDAINGETEITLSQTNQDIFLPEESLTQAGPSCCCSSLASLKLGFRFTRSLVVRILWPILDW